MEIMYPGKAFSPFTTLSAGIGATDTNIPVEDISAFPPAPNFATIGTDENAETVLYAAIAGNMLSGCERGKEGAARTWSSGNIIGRNFTAEDYRRIIANLGMAATGVNDIKAVNGNIPLSAADIPLYPTAPEDERQTVKEAIDSNVTAIASNTASIAANTTAIESLLAPAVTTTRTILPADWQPYEGRYAAVITPPEEGMARYPDPDVRFSIDDLEALNAAGAGPIGAEYNDEANILRLIISEALAITLSPEVTWRSSYA